MSSQFNSFIASSHRADLHRSAERSRLAETAEKPASAAADDVPTLLRSRRFGRLSRILPPAGRRSTQG